MLTLYVYWLVSLSLPPSLPPYVVCVYFLASQKVLCCALYAVLFVVKISMQFSSTIMSLMVEASKAL